MKNIKPINQEINNELNSNKKCRIDSNIISKCADNSMLRLDFQECLNTPSTVTNHQQMNSFSIKKYGDVEAKQLAINKRLEMEALFGYR